MSSLLYGDYFADFVVDRKIIIELKTVEHLQKIHFAQVKNYLKAIHIGWAFLLTSAVRLWNSKE